MSDRVLPKTARTLVDAVLDAGWQLSVEWSTQGGHLFVTIHAKHCDDWARCVRATWHSLDTGTVWLFSCLLGAGVNCPNATLKATLAYVRGES